MRDIVAATFANPAAPQAPARNPSPDNAPHKPASIPSSIETFNSHRKIRRPKLGDKKVYRPVRRNTLSRIDEAPPQTRPRSKSLQISTDFSSTRPMVRSRSNMSMDTSRSIPACSYSTQNQLETSSPQYAEPRGYDSSSSCERPASMTDLPIMIPLDPVTGAYIPYPEYSYYQDDVGRVNRYKWKRNRGTKTSKSNNLFLAFMY
ncbi:uncharacterized protein LOC106718216 [Papilio machaon]|uniref:uncharacterized protein LOC106718216 n=1 Tax=Papilio machaon TaxID=76193 RepID=UPI001E6639EB|nr:uncharacterized protein LOC106718216 [Papilio machaon]